MPSHINGKSVDSCFGPELRDYAIKHLGHAPIFVTRISLAKLKEIVLTDKRYEKVPAETLPTYTAESPTIPQEKMTGTVKPSSTSALLDALANDIAPVVAATVRDQLSAEFAAALDNRPKETVITIKHGEIESTTRPDIRHHKFDEILKLMVSNIPGVYIHGPAGSGKTYLGKQLAEVLSQVTGEDVAFFPVAFGPGSELYHLLGIPPINGHPAQKSPLWRGWDRPSLVLLDEMDAAPELFVQLNAAIGNGFATFADGETYHRHPHCYILAAGNTNMGGATMDYSSRSRQDKATVDRFAFVTFDYDETMEIAAAGSHGIKWTKHVQKLRHAHRSLGASAPDLLITPRASINGARVLATNPDMQWETLEDAFIWRGASDDDKAKVRKALKTL